MLKTHTPLQGYMFCCGIPELGMIASQNLGKIMSVAPLLIELNERRHEHCSEREWAAAKTVRALIARSLRRVSAVAEHLQTGLVDMHVTDMSARASRPCGSWHLSVTGWS